MRVNMVRTLRACWALAIASLAVPAGSRAAVLHAQKVCKTGCACGNACISCSRTCRVGPGTASKPTTAVGADTATIPPSGSSRGLLAAPMRDSGARAGTTPYRGRWFGSAANRFYFRDGCPIEQLLAIGDQVVLPDSASAIAAGFRRLLLPGC